MDSTTVGIVVAVGIVLVLWATSIHNRLRQLRNRVDNAYAQIDVQLKRRYDLIPNLVETVKGYAKQEKDVLVEVTNARSKVGGAGTVPDKIAANNELTGALSRLMVVVERYPDLKSNQNFLQLQDELAGTENRIAVERMRYNDAVKIYNQAVRTFPANIVAGMFGFKEAAFFEAPKEAQAPPQVKF